MAQDEQERNEAAKSIIYIAWLSAYSREELIKRIISADPTGKNDDEYQEYENDERNCTDTVGENDYKEQNPIDYPTHGKPW